jgi:hypothetical protein
MSFSLEIGRSKAWLTQTFAFYQGGKEPATNQSLRSRWEYYIVELNGRQGDLWIDAPISEDATRDLISRSPGQHDLLLPRVRSPPLPYPQGTRGAPPYLKTATNTSAPCSELHPVKCDKLVERPLEFVTSSQDLVQCFPFGNINNIMKTIRRCQMLTSCYFVKRRNSDPILSLWSLRSFLECQLVVDANSTLHIRMRDQIATVDGRRCPFSYSRLGRGSVDLAPYFWCIRLADSS